MKPVQEGEENSDEVPHGSCRELCCADEEPLQQPLAAPFILPLGFMYQGLL